MHPAASFLRGQKHSWKTDLAIVVVSCRYSTSSARVLDKEGRWKGCVAGRSLATLMSELRSRTRGATNIVITRVEWTDEAEAGAWTREGRLGQEAPRAPPASTGTT